MSATIRFAVLVVLLLFISASARAQSEPAAGSSNSQLQLALTDAVAVGAATTGYFVGRDVYSPVSGFMWGVGGIGYFIGGPIVHLANREFGLAGASAAMRLALPIIGAGIAANMATCTPGEWFCGPDEAAQGFAIGAAMAVIADNTLTAVVKASEAPPPNAPAPRAAPISVRVLPRFVAAPNVAMFGVGGQF